MLHSQTFRETCRPNVSTKPCKRGLVAAPGQHTGLLLRSNFARVQQRHLPTVHSPEVSAETSSSGPYSSPFSANGASANGASANRVSLNGASANGVSASANGASNVAVGQRATNGTAATAADVEAAALSAAASGGARQGASQQLVAGSANGTGKPMLTHMSPPVELDAPADDVMGSCDAGQLESCAYERLAEKEKAEAAALATAAAAAVQEAAIQDQKAELRTQKVAGNPYRAPSGRWGKFRRYSVWQRTFEIWSFAFKFFFRLWLTGRKFTYGKQGMTPERVSARKARLAAWLREGLVRLGPTFIKVGQQFSTRVDVLAPEFVQELEKLQDNVPAFDDAAAVSIVEKSLGTPVLAAFDEFDRVPIAAASLGQVHLARLDGARVVVKVQRPGLKELFDIDLKNLRVLAQWLQAVDPKSDGAARDWVAIYDECSRILYQEIDYVLEGQNADWFRTNFAATPWIKVPKVIWERTTTNVLTMEYAPGVKINRVAELERMGVDRKLLARRAVESYLQQLLTHGFFHADPHPGNIAVDADGGGRLIYYDFGMMGRIPSDVRGGLLELFYGVYQKDPDRCIDALVAMGVLVPGGDRTAVRRTAEFFLTSFQERLAAQRAEAKANPTYGQTFKAQASKDDKKAKRKQILSNIGEDLLVAAADKPFRFPATFTFVVRSFTVLDGIGKCLDPRFDISEIAAPYARELLLEGRPQVAKLRQELGKRLALQNRAVKNLFQGPNLIEDVAVTVRKLERGELKPRVRALEAERALSRVQAYQKVVTRAILLSTLVNLGTLLSVSACSAAATASFAGAGVSAVLLLFNWLKVKNMERREAQLVGGI